MERDGKLACSDVVHGPRSAHEVCHATIEECFRKTRREARISIACSIRCYSALTRVGKHKLRNLIDSVELIRTQQLLALRVEDPSREIRIAIPLEHAMTRKMQNVVTTQH